MFQKIEKNQRREDAIGLFPIEKFFAYRNTNCIKYKFRKNNILKI